MAAVTVETPGLAPEHPQIIGRLVTLKQPVGHTKLIYVFCANGEFCYDRERVRWIISRPGDRYIYFSKIEALAHYPPEGDPDAAVRRCKLLLSEALAVLVAEHYPRREQLKGRQ